MKRVREDDGESVSSAAQSVVAATKNEILTVVLDNIMDRLHEALTEVHQLPLATSPVIDRALATSPVNDRLLCESRKQAFRSTLNTLQRSYTAFLHSTYEGKDVSELAVRVQDLVDAINHKLRTNCEASAHEGKALMEDLLEHWQLEFKWMKTIEILKACLDVARREKVTAYEDLTAKESRLRNLRAAGDSN